MTNDGYTIRTTNRPDKEITVSAAEYLDLQRQKLIVRDDSPDDVPEGTWPGLPEEEHRDTPEQIAAVQKASTPQAKMRSLHAANPDKNVKEGD